MAVSLAVLGYSSSHLLAQKLLPQKAMTQAFIFSATPPQCSAVREPWTQTDLCSALGPATYQGYDPEQAIAKHSESPSFTCNLGIMRGNMLD